MAELDVQPKRSNPWWIWLLIAIIALAVLFFLFKGCNSKDTTTVVSDSTTTTTTSDSSTTQNIAATAPDWNNVDFDAPKASYDEVNDPEIVVSGNDKYTIYTLGENILFATDKNTLQANAESKLKTIVASLNKRFKGAQVGVFGSTDSTGDAGENKQLGADRAEAVKNWLTENGIDAVKVSVHSLGESKPVATNATAGGRKQNRNVQIVAFPDSTAVNQ
jgi:outer membrane protein OmpA-like peptidoglycan-associated protein